MSKMKHYNVSELTNILISGSKIYNSYLPNEIFEDLVRNNSLDDNDKSSNHIAFAYCYVYIITFLYRNIKYGEDFNFSESTLKELLGVSKNNKGLNYITKKGGILNQLRYIDKTTDFPIRFLFDENDILFFEKVSDYKEVIKENRRHKTINFPVKGFYRTVESEGERELSGCFYEVENTHIVPIEIFIFCLGNRDIGTIGFYIYSYLKHKNDIFKTGYCCSLDKLIVELGIRKSTVCDMLKTLEEYNMISNDHQTYIINKSPDKNVKPCTYRTKPFEKFIKTGEKNTVAVRRIMTNEEHDKLLQELEAIENDNENPFIN